MERYQGGCLCADVRFVATGHPKRVGVCHCLDCRKMTGSLFSACAIFGQEAVAIEGETRAYEGRFSCVRCGSFVFGRSDDEVEVSLGAFDEPNQLVPTYELWTVRRERFLPPFSLDHRYDRDRNGVAPGGG